VIFGRLFVIIIQRPNPNKENTTIVSKKGVIGNLRYALSDRKGEADTVIKHQSTQQMTPPPPTGVLNINQIDHLI
jgi:hypothetical protein